jgi:hypothetical protein|tara:strand:- start:4496 stop:4675 length:180 start_codon:yes stop_codon:yes gene_type:complete
MTTTIYIDVANTMLSLDMTHITLLNYAYEYDVTLDLNTGAITGSHKDVQDFLNYIKSYQ